MSADPDVMNPSFVSYEINGAQFIVQPLGNSSETASRLEEVENDADDSIRFVEEMIDETEDAESIPLVCLDGQVYAIHDGALQALDIGQLEYETAIDSAEAKNLEDNEEDGTDCVEITRYVSDSEISVQDEESEELEVSREDEERRLFVVAKENINADDFVEVVTAFKCKMCPYTTQDREELVKHFENVHANPANKAEPEESESADDVKLMYMCGECSNCFPSMEDCREHMIKDHQLMDRGGDMADKSMDDARKLAQSNFKPSILGARRPKSPTIEENFADPKPRNAPCNRSKKTPDSNDRNVKCTYRGCFHKFSTDVTMQQHAVCHLDVPYHANFFKCNICRDVKFAKWKVCSLHLWRKHQIDVDLFSCKICKVYKSTTLLKVLAHMRVHSDNREFECPDCGKCFKQSSQLRNHRVMHLDRKTSEIPRWYTSKTCDLCGKTYADSKCLKNHIQAVHSKLRPYVCNVCGHSSARKAMLQMHLRQHTGDKPFNCELCDYKTGDHNSLRRHMMRHTGVRPYKCPHCPYSAIQSNSYKNHLRSKHPLLSGLFTCDLCPFKTVKNESYLQHIGDHQKGLIKTIEPKKDVDDVEVFPGNIAAAQLIYSCLGAYSKVGKTIEASLMSSSTSADGTSQTITIQIPSKHLEGSRPIGDTTTKNSDSSIEQDDDETMHCFLKIPREEEESIDTGGISIPAEPEEESSTPIVVDS